MPVIPWTGQLSPEQLAAVDTLLRFSKPIQTLAGYAGVGKTTVIKALQQQLRNFAVCAYTGKAANVLRKKGVSATTIHQRVYRPRKEEEHGEVTFERKSYNEICCDGFIIDEASMVDDEIYQDLTSYALPIIFVGDHGQLEPVSGGTLNLMAKPDITLEEIHRNAGEIAQFAEFIRKGNQPADWYKHENYTGKAVTFASTLTDLDSQPDQFICAFNKTRVLLNKAVRTMLGFPEDHPVRGDRVMCLQNDHSLSIYNGMQGTIAAINDHTLVFDSDGKHVRVPYVYHQFNRESKPEFNPGSVPFDYAYCVTAHKFQGDEADYVAVLEQRCRAWDHTRWAYTAASRARQRLVWI